MQPPIQLTRREAKRFLLLTQGLLGPRRFQGKEGALSYIRQAGCVQYDPVDVCGKNAQLVLQSRVEGFTKGMLEELLYTDRRLFDYWDKNMAILPVEDWKYFSRTRQFFRENGPSRQAVDAIAPQALQQVGEMGFACSRQLALKERVDWTWSPTTLSRAALETLYFRGELGLHHKQGTMKYYSLAKDLFPQGELEALDPNQTEEEYFTWQVSRRIGAVGMLWNRPSDAFLGIRGMKAAHRSRAFSLLLERGEILPAEVEGVKDILYFRSRDRAWMEKARSGEEWSPRCELIAPLDSLLWDRRMVEAVFGFAYKWEIYTPKAQRKYGYYVLPLLLGEELAGRVEVVCDQRGDCLRVACVWPESGRKLSKRELNRCFKRFAAFHGLSNVEWQL